MAGTIKDWLEDLGLGKYAEVFAQNDVDFRALPHLDREDLKELGVSLGHRKIILAALSEMKTGEGAENLVQAQAQPVEKERESAASPGPKAERRQLTVMFCDLVGSTELSTRFDPEDLGEMIHAYQDVATQVIRGYDGYIAKYMGDGMLVYFGYPQAQERDAERAVRTALGIIEAMADLNMRADWPGDVELAVRIGIDTGLVVVGEVVGEGDAQERTVVGETPNLAARLQGLAKPNGIVLGSVSRDLAGDAFDYDDLGARELKGIEGFVKAWAVRGLKEKVVGTAAGRVASDPKRTALVGRDEEVGLLRRAWQQTKAEGRGQAVLISGEPGIGKTALIETLRTQVRAEDHTRIAFRCSPYHTGSALYPVTEHLKRYLGWQPEHSDAERLARLESILSDTNLQLAEAVPLVASLLTLSLPEDRYPHVELSPQQLRQQTQDALVSWILDRAEESALLAFCEDIHWADPTTLEFLGMLLEQAPTVPILLVFTTRPDFQPPWPSRSHLTPITLARLERPQTEAMITRLAGDRSLPSEVTEHIAAKSDGVPLYVEELTKTVLGSNVLREEGDRYVLAGSLSAVTIPATLQESLMARLDRLPKVRELVQLGAVLGREFAYDMLLALVELDEPLLQDGLDRLVDGELLYQRGRPPKSRYIFKHALVQDAAYHSLLKRTRQQYHGQVAQLLEERFPDTVENRPEVIAHHYTEAGAFDKAFVQWNRAGQRALDRSANAEAIGHFEMAVAQLESLPGGDSRTRAELDLLIKLGGCLAAVEGYAARRTFDVYNRAHALCRQVDDEANLLAVLRGLWICRLVHGELKVAHELAKDTARLAEEKDDTSYRTEAQNLLGVTLACLGDFPRARDHLEESIALYGRTRGTRDFMFDSVVGILPRCFLAHTLWHLGYPDQALERMNDAMALANELSHPFSVAMARDYAAMLHQFRRDGEKARAWADSAIALCEERGFAYYLAWGRIIRGWTLVEEGGGQRDIAQMRDGLTALKATGAALRLPYYLSSLAEALGKVRRLEEALKDLDEAFVAVDANGEHWRDAELHRLRGEFLLADSQDAHQSAEKCFQKALEVAAAQNARSLELRAAKSLARLWHELGRRNEARDLLGPIVEWFTEGLDTSDLQDARALLEDLA